MSSVAIVMAYYENAHMLQLQLQEWAQYRVTDKMALSAVIVDDGSPRNPAEPVIRKHGNVGFPIQLFRIKENKPWNQDGARNLGMKHVSGWTLMTDMDHMLSKDQVAGLRHVVSHEVEAGSYYMPQRRDFDGAPMHRHANSYVFLAEDFWKMGGYDEDFSGVYGSDGNFRKCMRAGLTEKATDKFYLNRWPSSAISDANTKDWGRKDSPYHRSQFSKIEAKSKGPAYRATNPLRFEWEQVL
jgi:hypothetical protein